MKKVLKKDLMIMDVENLLDGTCDPTFIIKGEDQINEEPMDVINKLNNMGYIKDNVIMAPKGTPISIKDLGNVDIFNFNNGDLIIDLVLDEDISNWI